MIALLILLLILLPLYLWPLRGGLSALSGGSVFSGPPKDPRNPSALASIPGDVWDALMGRAPQAPPGPAEPAAPPKPRNLTMITEHAPGAGTGLGEPDGGSPVSGLVGPSPSLLAGLVDPTDYKSGDESSPPVTPSPFGDGLGSTNGWTGIGSLSNVPRGLFGDGGTSKPILSLQAGDPPAPQPTPEPATIMLVGANVALLSVVAWRRRRRAQETTSIG